MLDRIPKHIIRSQLADRAQEFIAKWGLGEASGQVQVPFLLQTLLSSSLVDFARGFEEDLTRGFDQDGLAQEGLTRGSPRPLFQVLVHTSFKPRDKADPRMVQGASKVPQKAPEWTSRCPKTFPKRIQPSCPDREAPELEKRGGGGAPPGRSYKCACTCAYIHMFIRWNLFKK